MTRRLLTALLLLTLATPAWAQTYARYPTVSGATYGTLVAGSASANTKGTATEIAASTSFNSSQLFIGVISASVGNEEFLFDIVSGASLNVVVVADVMVQSMANGVVGVLIPVTVNIPTGTRLGAQVQSQSGGSDVLQLYLIQTNQALQASTPVATYGATTATTTGVVIDPGGTANTKPATFTTVAASTSADHTALILLIGLGGNTAPAAADFSLDIATGAISSETIVLPDIAFHTDSTGDTNTPMMVLLPVTIASGTRISARAQSTTNDATDRLFQLSIIGITLPPAVAATEHSAVH